MVLFFGLLTASIFLSCAWLWPAFKFLNNYRHRIAEDGASRRSDLEIAGTATHIYPGPKPGSATLVIVPGLHPNGILDPRFVAFAKCCTEAGFQVVAPDIKDFRNFRITRDTFRTAQTFMDALPDHLDLRTRNRIGVLGISYGSGPAFFIATNRNIDFLVSIGGYYNLAHAIEFSFSGNHGSTKRESHEWGRLIFALNHMEELAEEPDAGILLQSLQLRLQLKETEAESLEARLSVRGKELLQGILKGLTEAQTNRFRDIARKRESEARQISPETFLGVIDPRTVLYLLHGVSDDSIPYEESLELHEAAKRDGFRSHCLITTGLTHVDITSPSRVLEFLKLLHWTRLLLREV